MTNDSNNNSVDSMWRNVMGRLVGGAALLALGGVATAIVQGAITSAAVTRLESSDDAQNVQLAKLANTQASLVTSFDGINRSLERLIASESVGRRFTYEDWLQERRELNGTLQLTVDRVGSISDTLIRHAEQIAALTAQSRTNQQRLNSKEGE